MTLHDLTEAAVETCPTTADETMTDEHARSEFDPRTSAVAGSLTTAKRTTVTFYLTETLRNRARAAYRSTSFEERDSSWSEMLNKALIAEVERREAEYNKGQAFTASAAPLSPGRPIGF